jgi:hypothetical protein
MNQDKMMIARQGELITKLNTEMKELHRRLEIAEQWEPAARYYINIQKLALADEEVMEAWQEFLIVLKLKEHDAEAILERPLRAT